MHVYYKMPQNLLFSQKGFTLIELMVVVAIIGVLASASLSSVNEARLNAQYTIARTNIKQLADLVEVAKGTQMQTLPQITGSFCSECACRSGSLPTPNIRDYPPSHACFTAYQNVMNTLNNATNGVYTIKNLPLDPWGAPFLFNENEGESGLCIMDNISSAGPNGIYYDSDDVIYNIPSVKCGPNPIPHHPNTNWP